MLWLMLLRIVWMDSMSHISWHKVTFVNGSVEIFFRCITLETPENSFSGLHKHVAVCTLSWLWTNFLMVKQANNVNIIWFLSQFVVINYCIKRCKTTCHVIKSWRIDELIMKTTNCWLLEIITVELKINDLFNFDTKVFRDSIEEGYQMFGLNVVDVVFIAGIQSLREHLVNWICCDAWFQMRFSIELKFIIWGSVEVNTKTWDVHDGLVGVPQGACDYTFCILVDNLSSKSKISIKPGSPETTSILLQVYLLESTLVVNFGMWSSFKNWWVSVTANYLKQFQTTFSCDILANSKSNNCWLISSIVVSLSRGQLSIPLITTSNNNF